MAQEPDLNEIVKRLEIVERKLNLYEVPDADVVLEKIIDDIDGRTLQLVLREIDAQDLVLAMIGVKTQTLSKIKAAVSHKAWNMLLDDVSCSLNEGVFVWSVKKAQSKFVNFFYVLSRQGEIVVSTPEFIAIEKKFDALKEVSREKVQGLDVWKKDVLEVLKKV